MPATPFSQQVSIISTDDWRRPDEGIERHQELITQSINESSARRFYVESITHSVSQSVSGGMMRETIIVFSNRLNQPMIANVTEGQKVLADVLPKLQIPSTHDKT